MARGVLAPALAEAAQGASCGLFGLIRPVAGTSSPRALEMPADSSMVRLKGHAEISVLPARVRMASARPHLGA